MARVLVVEDEAHVRSLLQRALEREGYEVETSERGDTALERALADHYDLIVLDLMIPPPDGITLTRELRRAERWTPILMLTAKGSVEDRVAGLDAGADDYLAKPFALAELRARVRALVRRRPQEADRELRVGDIVLDPAAHEVSRAGIPVELTPKEFDLLHLMMERPGEVLSRRTILDHVWDFAFESDSNVVDVYIRYLREKLDRPFGQESIETVRGIGYRLRP